MLTSVLTNPDLIRTCMDAIAERVSNELGRPVDYREAALCLQSPEAEWRSGERLALVWYELGDPHWTDALCDLLDRQVPTADHVVPSDQRARIEAELTAGYELARATVPQVAGLLDEAMAVVLLATVPDRVGGSAAARVGITWQNAVPGRSAIDYAENLVHELIHQLVLIVDLVDPLFVAEAPRLAEPDARVTSAILGWQRGYDLAFHSAEVALGIAEFHLALGDTERAANTLNQLLVCVNELDQKREFMTPFGQLVLDDLIACSMARWRQLGAVTV